MYRSQKKKSINLSKSNLLVTMATGISYPKKMCLLLQLWPTGCVSSTPRFCQFIIVRVTFDMIPKLNCSHLFYGSFWQHK